MIDSRPEPRLFRELADPWQWALLSRLIPSIEAVAGVRTAPYSGPLNFWLTLPRGHDKSSAIGRLVNWALAFAQKPLRSIVAAADRDQAGLLLEFMKTEASLNPWLHKRLDFKNWLVSGQNGAALRVLAADAQSSYGLKEDLMIFDEITHWTKPGMFHAVLTGREKRPHSVLIIITNAGILKSWQHDAFLIAKTSPDWYVYEAPGKLATWMSDARINELRRMLPRSMARRLYDNIWVDASEDCGFVTKEEVLACIDPTLAYRPFGLSKNAPYFAALDYGPVRDRTVLAVLHQEKDELVLDRMDIMQGSKERRVPISLVESWIDDVRKKFPRVMFIVDEYSLEGTIQKYQGIVEMERFEARGGKANYEMAANLRNLIINKKIRLYEGAGELILDSGIRENLVDELASVAIKPMAYGYRIDNTLPNSHDDRTVAIGMAALQAVHQQGKISFSFDDRYF